MSLISTKNLTIATPSRTICRDLTLTIFPGEIWGILGPNGAGKTTFLHTLAHLFPAKSGEIWLKNSPIQQLSRKKIAQKIGLLFQSTNDFFPQTVEEFCLTGRFPHQSFFKKNSPQDAKMVT
ncbi:MAG: ATP-binding ABC transporter protein, partial [uncultured bacterium]